MIGGKTNSLYREIIMHLHVKTLRMVISLDTSDGEENWHHVQVTYGKIKNRQILAIWEEFFIIIIRKPEKLLQRDMLNSMKNNSCRANLSRIVTG